MPITPPRHPIVIIGGGLAGLSAAAKLQDLGIPHLILERFNRPGGRFNSRAGDGWLADHGTQFIRRSDETLGALIRRVGMETRRVSIQGPIHQLIGNNQVIVPQGGGYDSDRLCLLDGFGSLTTALAGTLNIQYNRPVGAVRWDNDTKAFWWEKEGQVFWFEDEDGQPIRDHTTQQPILASGVILATTPTVARRIAEKSPSIGGLLPLLEQVKHSPCFTGMYRIPRADSNFYALKGDSDSVLSWVAFEELKAPGRIADDESLLIAQAGARFSDELLKLSDAHALSALYVAVRRLLFDLPEMPLTQTCKRWNMAHISSPPLGEPAGGRWPVNPPQAPFALAGDYVLGNRAEDAARSGQQAAKLIAAQLPRRRSFLGLEIQS
ncbi:NAD(P)-binding protein [bacterium]|nr:NAD(P)-binding protein [bacterium]